MKIRKGDRVQVLSGKDRGKTGTVTRAYPERGRVIVDGVNIAKKHQKPNPNGGVAGGIVEKEMPIDHSNVLLWNHKTSKGDRVGFKSVGEGVNSRKVRFFKSNEELVDG